MSTLKGGDRIPIGRVGIVDVVNGVGDYPVSPRQRVVKWLCACVCVGNRSFDWHNTACDHALRSSQFPWVGEVADADVQYWM